MSDVRNTNPGVLPLVAGSNTIGSVFLAGGTAMIVIGNVAEDAANSGNPVLIGFEEIDFGSSPTSVGVADRVNGYATSQGQQWGLSGHPAMLFMRTNVSTSVTSALWITVNSGQRWITTAASVLASGANTGNTSVIIGYGSNTLSATSSIILAHPGVPAGGGASEGNGGATVGRGIDGEDIRFSTGNPGPGSIDLLIKGFYITR